MLTKLLVLGVLLGLLAAKATASTPEGTTLKRVSGENRWELDYANLPLITFIGKVRVEKCNHDNVCVEAEPIPAPLSRTITFPGPGYYKVGFQRTFGFGIYSDISWEQYVPIIDRSTAEISGLASKHRPAFSFHKDEKRFPLALPSIFESITVADLDRNSEGAGGLAPETKILEVLPHLSNSKNRFFINKDKLRDLGPGSRDSFPIYWYSELDALGQTLYITYVAFYSYDFKSKSGPEVRALGDHGLDRESITIEFRRSTGTWEPVSVVYAGHLENQPTEFLGCSSFPFCEQEGSSALASWEGGRVKIPWSRISLIGDRPVVYVARGSHAMFPLFGWYRLLLRGVPILWEPAGDPDPAKLSNPTRLIEVDLASPESSALIFSGYIIDGLGHNNNGKLSPHIRFPAEKWYVGANAIALRDCAACRVYMPRLGNPLPLPSPSPPPAQPPAPLPPPSPPTSGPDLVPLDARFTPTTTAPSGPVTVSFTVANVGFGGALPSTAVVRINTSATSAAGPNLLTDAIPSLAGGSAIARSLTVAAPPSPGTYFVWVIADNGTTAGQGAAATANDFARAAGTLTVSAMPVTGVDLVAQNLSLSPGTVPPGGRMTVSFSVRNTGTVTAGASTAVVRVTSSATSFIGNDLASVSVGALAPGAVRGHNATVTVPSVAGSYRVWVLVDSSRTAGQAGFALTNDASVAVNALTVADGGPGGPDLVPVNISVDPGSINTDGMTLVTFTIRNTSTASTAAASLAAVRVNQSATTVPAEDLKLMLIPVLGPGASVTQTVGINVAELPGTYRVWVVADIRGTAGQTSSAAVVNDPAVAPIALTIVPRVVPAGGSAEGAYDGSLIGGAEPAFRMLVLENGEIWALPGFMTSGNLVSTGFLQGSGLYSGATLNSTNLRDFRFVPAVAATTSASFNAQAGTISGTVVSSLGTVTFSGGPITDIPFDYNQPATMDKIRGVWSLTSNTGDRIALTVLDSGDFTATSILGCRFAGRVVPRSSGKNVYNVSLTFGSAPCLIPGQSMTGIALLNRVPNGQTQLTVGGVNADRTVGLAASGVR